MTTLKVRLTLVLVIPMALSVLAAIFQPQIVEAGTNGQQVQFICPGISSGSVRGYNQNGEYVNWEGNANNGFFITSGWWWVGWVRVYYYIPSQRRYESQAVNVPRYQISNLYVARC